jgi:hypothetical protein
MDGREVVKAIYAFNPVLPEHMRTQSTSRSAFLKVFIIRLESCIEGPNRPIFPHRRSGWLAYQELSFIKT